MNVLKEYVAKLKQKPRSLSVADCDDYCLVVILKCLLKEFISGKLHRKMYVKFLKIFDCSVFTTFSYGVCRLHVMLFCECYSLDRWCDGREDCVNGEDEEVCEATNNLCLSFYRIDTISVYRRPPPAVVHFDGYGKVSLLPVSRQFVALGKVRLSTPVYSCYIVQ